jgi:hypothetical protein
MGLIERHVQHQLNNTRVCFFTIPQVGMPRVMTNVLIFNYSFCDSIFNGNPQSEQNETF